MDLTQRDVLRILKILDESDYEQLRLEVGELKLVVNKKNASPYSEKRQDFPFSSRDREVEDAPEGVHSTTLQTDPPFEKTPLKQEGGLALEADALQGLTPVRSPMLGTFYRSPKPGDPPFVKTGQVVDEETKVCIIEVMKLFSTIHAGTKGRIAKVCAEDGQLVEYNQVLFWVEPQTDRIEG